jgi:hypothetical protein
VSELIIASSAEGDQMRRALGVDRSWGVVRWDLAFTKPRSVRAQFRKTDAKRPATTPKGGPR